MSAKIFHRLSGRAVDRTVALHVGTDMLELMLYGIYLAVFVSFLHPLLMKRRSTKWPVIAATLLMFGISTTDMAVTMYYLFWYTLDGLSPPYRYPRMHLFITNNIFAEAILIHRFYMLWHRKRWLIILPLLVLTGSSICGYLFANTPFGMLYRVSMWSIFGLNMSLTLLIGGKSFWSVRQVRSIIGTEMSLVGYRSMCSLIIDSGSVYSIYLLLTLTINSIFLQAGLGQIVGMVPTIIIIRTLVKRRSFEGTVMYRASAGSSSTPVLDSIFSLVGPLNTVEHSPRSSVQQTLPPDHPASGDTIDLVSSSAPCVPQLTPTSD